MRTCWDVLGITSTTDKRLVKRAYAKMLAKFHPEEFPEKFAEINNAYKSALAYCDYGDGINYDGSNQYDSDEYGSNEYGSSEYASNEHDDSTHNNNDDASINDAATPINIEALLKAGIVIDESVLDNPSLDAITSDNPSSDSPSSDSPSSSDNPFADEIDTWWQRITDPDDHEADLQYDDYFFIDNIDNLEDMQKGVYINPHAESIFTTDTISAEVTEAETRAKKALDEFKFQINTAKGHVFHNLKRNKMLKAYVATDQFKSVRRNPAFIEGVIKLIPSADFNHTHIAILRKALGIKKKWDASRYPSEVGLALDKLDAALKARSLYYFLHGKEKRDSQITNFHLSVKIIVVVFCLMGVLSFIYGRIGSDSGSNSGSGLADGIIGSGIPVQHLVPTSPTPAPARRVDLNVRHSQATFEELVLPNPEATERWRESLVDGLTDWLYEATGTRAVLITRDFPFLEGDFEMPQRLFYFITGEMGFNVLDMMVHFTEDAQTHNAACPAMDMDTTSEG